MEALFTAMGGGQKRGPRRSPGRGWTRPEQRAKLERSFVVAAVLAVRQPPVGDATSSLPSRRLATKLFSKLGEERNAGVKLGSFNKFIRHMGLLDVARAADHCRAACLLEQPSLRPIRDGARAI